MVHVLVLDHPPPLLSRTRLVLGQALWGVGALSDCALRPACVSCAVVYADVMRDGGNNGRSRVSPFPPQPQAFPAMKLDIRLRAGPFECAAIVRPRWRVRQLPAAARPGSAPECCRCFGALVSSMLCLHLPTVQWFRGSQADDTDASDAHGWDCRVVESWSLRQRRRLPAPSTRSTTSRCDAA